MVDYYKEFGLSEDATEAQIRDAVGAPSLEDEDECLCGKKINECDESYDHITSGY
jgi:hypothetical protein